MKLKHLEIQGFKSFPDKTVFKFQENGLTAVVGPNGCGKSNIVDAVRWTLGEQSAKLLRGQLMEDVIFNGSEKRRATGLAEVTLLFENNGSLSNQWRDYSEISISRKLFRTGESEYLINNVPCRLKDIRELLADAGGSSRGYSIVEQGRISLLINSRPEEKRALIEEAAGVLKYRMRRLESERKLERTRQNILRVSDIIREVKRQVDSLKRSAAKARRYHRMRDELNGLVLRQRFEEFSGIQEKLAGLEAELARKRSELQGLESELSILEAREETLKLELLSDEERISEYFEEVRAFESEIAHLEGDISVKKGGITSLEERLRRLEEDRKELKRKTESDENERVQLELELASIEDEHGRYTSEMEDASSAFNDAELELARTRSQQEEVRSSLFTMGTERNRLDMEIESSQRALTVLGRRRNDISARINEASSRLSEADENLTSSKKELDEASSASINLQDNLNQLRSDLSSFREEAGGLELSLASQSEKQAEMRGLQKTLLALEEEMEGFPDGVRNVLKEYAGSQAGGVLGVVADHLEVPQKYEKAVMAVLGDRLQHVIVDDPERGRSAVNFLKDHSKGRGAFIPVEPRSNGNGVTSHEGLKEEGVLGHLSHLVKFSKDINGIGEFLLGDTLLVKDLDNAIRLWKRNGFTATMVTLDGDVLETTGVVTGGNLEGGEESVLARKRKLREVSKVSASIELEVNRLREKLTVLRVTISDSENSLNTLDERHRKSELNRMDQESSFSTLAKERDYLSGTIIDLRAEKTLVNDETSEITERIEQLRVRLEEVMADEKDAGLALSDLEGSYQKHGVLLEERRLEFEESRMRLNTIAVRKENSQKALKGALNRHLESEESKNRIDQEKEDSIKRIKLHHEDIEKAEVDVRTTVDSLEVCKNNLSGLREKQEEARSEAEVIAAKVRDVRNRVNLLRDAISNVDIRIHELRTERQHIVERVHEDHHKDVSTITRDEFEEGDFNEEAAAERIVTLRQKIAGLGEVNPGAVEEFDELNERFDFLTTQKADLEESIETLQKAIRKINKTSKERFLNTFREVNESFSRLFPRLFEGGSAEMRLVDENDPLNTGVEINVKPPGKKLRSMQLLSGGEKALVSLTMILSMFLVKPSPFCILDEVDAPLDDDNIGNFAKIIKEMSTNYQFLVITHNKLTMQSADVLYGITMREPGVSQVVSVKMKDVV